MQFKYVGDNMKECKEFINEILLEINPYDEITDETNLIEEGIIDSLSLVYIITRIEENYNIKINEELITPNMFINIEKISGIIRGSV